MKKIMVVAMLMVFFASLSATYACPFHGGKKDKAVSETTEAVE